MCRLTFAVRAGLFAALAVAAGCGTTRMTDTTRSATEMLLVSQALDNAVAQIDFSPLADKTVFLDTSAVEKDVVDKGYLVSLVRQQLLAQGALVQEEKHRAVYVLELRAGALGTDRHSLLVGTSGMTVPSGLGTPALQIPEIALAKKNDQRGIAKIGVFAYNRVTGRALWQSGTVEAMSRLQDTWVFGTGPFTRGTIRQRTELAGEPLPKFPLTLFGEKGDPAEPAVGTGPVHQQYFPTSDILPPPTPVPLSLIGITGAPAVIDRTLLK